MKAISVLLIEDSALFRSALETVLRRAGFPVRACSSKATPLRHARQADVVLLDIVTLRVDPHELAGFVGKWSSLAPVLLLGRDDRMEQLLVGVRAGAAGCINQTVSLQQLQRAIPSLAAGGSWYERTLGEKLLQYLLPTSVPPRPRLSRREAQILSYLLQGKTNQQIAATLGLSERSIAIHVLNLFRKTGTSNRTSLLLCAMRRGLVPA